MNDNNEHQQTSTTITDTQNSTFVNEECGDTMWDVVLKEVEERLRKIATGSQDKISPENTVSENSQ